MIVNLNTGVSPWVPP